MGGFGVHASAGFATGKPRRPFRQVVSPRPKAQGDQGRGHQGPEHLALGLSLSSSPQLPQCPAEAIHSFTLSANTYHDPGTVRGTGIYSKQTRTHTQRQSLCLFKKCKLEDNCFTVLCWFLHESAIGKHKSPLKPPSHCLPIPLGELPVLYNNFPLAIYFTQGKVYAFCH